MRKSQEGRAAPASAAARWAELLLALAVILVAAVRYLPRETPAARNSAVDLAARIDVNESPWYELIYLPGVGEVRAREIVRRRGVSGPFETLEDLGRIPGIGPATVSRIQAYLTGNADGDTGR